MARIEIADAAAWAEDTKLPVVAFNVRLLDQIESQVMTKLDQAYEITPWVDFATTPEIVKSVIAMLYVAWLYDRQYSEDQEQGNDYAAMLRASAQSLIDGMLDGSVVIPGTPLPVNVGQPGFFPTDESSLQTPTDLTPELGPSSFNMSRRF